MSSILDPGVFQADCLDFLEHIPDGSVQVVYVDPPSFEQVNAEISLDRYKTMIDKVLRQAYRILRPAGATFVQSTVRNATYLRPYIIRCFGEDQFIDEIFLQNSGNGKELVIYFAKTREARRRAVYRPVDIDEYKYFQKDESGRLYRLYNLISPLSHPNLKFEFKGYTPSKHSWKYTRVKLESLDQQGLIVTRPGGIPRLKRYLEQDNLLLITEEWSDIPSTISQNMDEAVDFTPQRPLELLRRIITTASDIGDVVVDPFCGSGTSLVCAHRLKRKWVGCDVSASAVQIAIERLQNEDDLRDQEDFLTGNTNFLRSRFPVIHRSVYRRFFISYSSDDAEEFINPFCQELEQAGLDYWRDVYHIRNSTEWKEELNQALDECQAMILFLSPSSMQSRFVRSEWQKYLSDGKPIFQLKCHPVRIPRELFALQHTPFAHRGRLIQQLKAME